MKLPPNLRLQKSHFQSFIMKKLSLILSALFFAALQLSGQSGEVKTDTFKVYGNCGMCKKVIEKAAKGVDGVKSAAWNVDTDIIQVSYKSDKTNLDAIKKAIAASGYDTEEFRAPDEVYSNLHGCCQYDRPPKQVKASKAVKATKQ